MVFLLARMDRREGARVVIQLVQQYLVPSASGVALLGRAIDAMNAWVQQREGARILLENAANAPQPNARTDPFSQVPYNAAQEMLDIARDAPQRAGFHAADSVNYVEARLNRNVPWAQLGEASLALATAVHVLHPDPPSLVQYVQARY